MVLGRSATLLEIPMEFRRANNKLLIVHKVTSFLREEKYLNNFKISRNCLFDFCLAPFYRKLERTKTSTQDLRTKMMWHSEIVVVESFCFDSQRYF
jgi:hypothetical protein